MICKDEIILVRLFPPICLKIINSNLLIMIISHVYLQGLLCFTLVDFWYKEILN